MKKLFLLPFIAAIFLASCKKDSPVKNNNKLTDTLQGNITADKTLDASKNYFLKGQVYVKNNATLTIPAGITVFAQVNDLAASKSVLVITRGSKLNINGTVDQPVVFTSAAATKKQGDWGAIVILGNAPTNLVGTTGTVAGLPVSNDTQ